MFTALSVTDVYVNGAGGSDPVTSPARAVPAVVKTSRAARTATRLSVVILDHLRHALEHVEHSCTETRRRRLAFALGPALPSKSVTGWCGPVGAREATADNYGDFGAVGVGAVQR
jgi:hypothetical protein